MENFLIPIGGGNEIGASSYLYVIGGVKILIDSGIRFNAKEPYPDFDLLKVLAPELDAIFITHAHIDHCGSIHILSSLYPDTPIYTTHETAQLLSLMVEDAIKVKYIKEKSEDEWKEYKLLDETFMRLERREFFDTLNIKDIEVKFLPAGHILGAAAFQINYDDSSSIYHTGDISLQPQGTVEAAHLPSSSVNLLVTESTYYYSNRSFEKEKAVEEFYQTIVKVFERKGKILIPVFALGRAQEIILLLTEGMKAGKIPPMTIYVDGLAREVSNIYENLLNKEFFNYYVQPAPTYEGIDFLEACEENLREANCIISTSGMLMENTPSYIYASLLSRNERNAIIFSGYLVEESFGYRLLNDREILKNFKCEIKRHHFSAHSDKKELQDLINALSPEKTVFIHGYPGKEIKYHGFNREVIKF
ncbi:MBL fold metallo-hydrolase [Desulfurobacterium thermolithotrophum]|uniref:MBL fold metallo-hydrolase n=1 Tax=Desulfurobacterium thermolithotrophum TaxID=64160 RepID=UPI0013D79B7D|nr:MBL fold metallo-hydrolase [Desulfurobacterium thermolithotrophum]